MAQSYHILIVDGDKGGVGKSIVTCALVGLFKNVPESDLHACTVGAADGTLGNPYVCGRVGLTIVIQRKNIWTQGNC